MVTRNIALNELPMRGISINTLSGANAAIAVVPSDSGILFVNKYTTQTTYTLPPVAEGAGKAFWFYNGQGSAAIKVKAQSAILVGRDSVTGAVLTSASNVSDSCVVFGDGTNYYAIILDGSWTTGSS